MSGREWRNERERVEECEREREELASGGWCNRGEAAVARQVVGSAEEWQRARGEDGKGERKSICKDKEKGGSR